MKSNASHLPPDAFLNKMETLLGAEYEPFRQSYAASPPVGLRVNTLKITVADFIKKSPFALSAAGEYEPAGFRVTDGSRPGQHPYHAAGLYYLQEPSAMVVGSLIRPQPGERVLDLAAAPGGKATHLAALMQGRGLLVANDVHTGRARLLVENLERWGVYNALVTSNSPAQLADHFGPIFDKVLVDAPCSGEGMFRRQGAFEWQEKIVAACARRQTAILKSTARLVRPGGLLVYATCTFSPEEDENVIAQFLATHEAYALIMPPRFAGFAPGRPSWVADEFSSAGIERTVRLWPHKFPGEGHFIALMQRQETAVPGTAVSGTVPKPARFKPPKQSQIRLWHEFVAAHLHLSFPDDRLLLKNGRLYLLPETALDASGLNIMRYGVLLGEIRRGYFKPAHALALALRAEDGAAVNLTADSATAYLSGHDLPSDRSNGWTLLTVDGHTIGWGKQVGSRLKNHYPHRHRRLSVSRLKSKLP